MRILLSPQFRDDAIFLARSGEVLIVNGARFDLSPLPEGHTLPAAAISSPWFAGDVVRREGVLQVTILFPHGLDAEEAARFPAPIIDPPDGPIELPDAGTATPVVPIDEEGLIDWSQAVAPEPLPPIVISAELLFFGRMNDDEYNALDVSVEDGESARVYRGWKAATVFEERTAMWDLLVKHLDAIGTTPARKAELLAPPSASAARTEAEPA